MISHRLAVVTLAAAAVLSFPAPSRASSITVGTLGVQENCLPFGCPTSGALGTYQQVYSSSVFSGPVSISSITFFETFDSLFTDSNELGSGHYTFSFSTTSASVNGLSTTLADNVGADSQTFFVGSLGGPLGGTTFTVSGTPFVYDPALGNLLLQVDIAGATNPGTYPFLTFFDSEESSPLFSRAYSSNGGTASHVGLVTQFDFQPVPEPATLLLLGTGLGAVAARRRLKKRA